jgi:hypothetical protein
MHGAALVAVADAEGFTALNKAADRYYGHYVVNADRHIFIKYTLGEGPEFVFSFSDSDKLEISALAGGSRNVFAVFVCNDVAITALHVDELSKVIDLHKPANEQVHIVAEPGKQLWFSGPQGDVPHAIARNAFPQSILA